MKSFLYIGISAIVSLFVWASTGSSQPHPNLKKGTWVLQLNASFNKHNDYNFKPSRGINYLYFDLDHNNKLKKTYRVKTLPVILVMKNGKVVKRWDADMSFKLNVTQQEILNYTR